MLRTSRPAPKLAILAKEGHEIIAARLLEPQPAGILVEVGARRGAPARNPPLVVLRLRVQHLVDGVGGHRRHRVDRAEAGLVGVNPFEWRRLRDDSRCLGEDGRRRQRE